jgi:hypothetical protein
MLKFLLPSKLPVVYISKFVSTRSDFNQYGSAVWNNETTISKPEAMLEKMDIIRSVHFHTAKKLLVVVYLYTGIMYVLILVIFRLNRNEWSSLVHMVQKNLVINSGLSIQIAYGLLNCQCIGWF